MRRWILPLLLVIPASAHAQGSNQRFNSIALGSSSGQPAAETGIIRLPNNGGIKLTTTSGHCNSLYARDVDGAVYTAMLTWCNANTPTIDLASNVTIGGDALLSWTDNAVDQMIYFRTSDNSFQPVAFGGSCSFSSGTLTCTVPFHWSALIGPVTGTGALFVVTAPYWLPRRRRVRAEAWA